MVRVTKRVVTCGLITLYFGSEAKCEFGRFPFNKLKFQAVELEKKKVAGDVSLMRFSRVYLFINLEDFVGTFSNNEHSAGLSGMMTGLTVWQGILRNLTQKKLMFAYLFLYHNMLFTILLKMMPWLSFIHHSCNRFETIILIIKVMGVADQTAPTAPGPPPNKKSFVVLKS